MLVCGLEVIEFELELLCGAIQGKEWRPSLHLSVVAIEKGAFWSPSNTVANFITILRTELIVACISFRNTSFGHQVRIKLPIP